MGQDRIRYITATHGSAVKIEDVKLEESLNQAAALAKGAENATNDQVDVAARLLTTITDIGKKVSVIPKLLEQNPQSEHGDIGDVDSHINFAAACSKLQLGLRPASALSVSLHQLYNKGDAQSSGRSDQILELATKRLVDAIVSAVAMQIDNSIMQVPALINDYIEQGGTISGLNKSHGKVAECLALFGKPGDHEEVKSNVHWLMKLRTLHILKLVAKVPSFLHSHTFEGQDSDWGNLMTRFETAATLSGRVEVRDQLLTYSSAQETQEGAAEMFVKYISRCDELKSKEFKPRTGAEWEQHKQELKKSVERKNVGECRNMLIAEVGTSNAQVLMKPQVVALLVEHRLKESQAQEAALKKTWETLANHVLNDGEVFGRSDAVDEELDLKSFMVPETTVGFTELCNDTVTQHDAMFWAMQKLQSYIQDTLWTNFMGIYEDHHRELLDVGVEHVIRKTEHANKKSPPLYLNGPKSGFMAEGP